VHGIGRKFVGACVKNGRGLRAVLPSTEMTPREGLLSLVVVIERRCCRILQARFARGEIDTDEFEEWRRF